MTSSAGRIVGIAGLGALALAAAGAGVAAQPQSGALTGAVPRNGAAHPHGFVAAQPQSGALTGAVPRNGAAHPHGFVAAQPPSGAPAEAATRIGAVQREVFAAAQPPSGAPAEAVSARAILDRYCVACHNARTLTAGLALDGVDPAHVADDAAVWEKVLRKLRTRMMPPSPRPRPDAATYASLVTWLETALDRAAAADPDPGRPAVQRLNRAEYANAVRDLLALDVDAQTLLPADDSGYGFDNIGDVLSVSPGLLERYLLAAAKISRQAVGDPTLRPTTAVYRTSPLLAQNGRANEDLPFGSRGGLAVRHHFPLDAEYVIRVALRGRARAGHALEVRLDRERVQRFDLGDRAPLEVRVPVAAGTRLLGVSFVEALERSLPLDGRPPPPPITSFAFTLYPNDPAVERVEVVGPYAGRTPADTPSRRAIFTCHPDTPGDETACAGRIVARLARRAYRRPVTAADTAPLLAAYEAGRREGAGFEDGVRWAIEALLVSPKFLFRVEQAPVESAPGAPYRVRDLDLASRLSFFLWSSIPDDELVDLAARGRLRGAGRPRAAGPPDARRCARGGAGGELRGAVALSAQPAQRRPRRGPVPRVRRQPPARAPAGDRAVRRQPDPRGSRRARPAARRLHVRQRAVGPALRHPRRLRQPLPAGVVSRRPARRPARARQPADGDLLPPPHLAGAAGEVAAREPAGGAAAPAAAGHPRARRARRPGGSGHDARTDGAASGEPRLRDLPRQDRPAGVRARELRRRGPVAARARTAPARPIDASGALPDGAPFDGPAAFREALLREPWATEFATTVTEKLLTYALGRGLEHYDGPAVRRILRDAAPGGYRWSSLMLGIVESVPFQMQRAPDAGAARAQ